MWDALRQSASPRHYEALTSVLRSAPTPQVDRIAQQFAIAAAYVEQVLVMVWPVFENIDYNVSSLKEEEPDDDFDMK